MLCEDVANGRLWAGSADGVRRSNLTSFYSSNPLFSAASSTAQGGKLDTPLYCNASVMCASCQGAPCFDAAYDSPVFDATCVCPVTATRGLDGPGGTQCGLKQLAPFDDGGVCREIAAAPKRSCAASSTVNSSFLFPSVSELRSYVEALRAAAPDGDSGACPPYGGRVPTYAGEHHADDDLPYTNRTPSSPAEVSARGANASAAARAER